MKSFKWLDTIRNIFISCGCSGIWENHPLLNKIWLVKTIKQRLSDLFMNELNGERSVTKNHLVLFIEFLRQILVLKHI